MSDMQRRIRSFVMRAGRMTEGQQKGWDAGFPQFGLTLDAGRLDWDAAFPNPGRRLVEIGFGMGDSLLEMAAADANTNFVGIEVHRPGVGRLLSGVLDRELNNLRVYAEDAVEIFERCIDDASLDAIQIYFPDPWHKKRHHKRRLIQPPFVALLTRKLKAGGILHLATDWENYAEQMLEVLEAAEGLSNVEGSGKYSPRPAYRPETKFERRGARLGHGVWDLIFERDEPPTAN
jgi:tRNA (guanine-N7-)-methyltransferase